MKHESEDELMDFVEELDIKESEAMDTVSPLIGPLPENATGPEDDDMNNDPNFKVDGDEDESRGEATFRFRVTNFSKIKESVLSPPCYIRNLPWKIMVMPRSNQHHPQGSLKSMGYFLQCNGDSDLASWTCAATAELRIISQKDGVEDMSRKISHMFYAKENDWGFSFFMSWNDILDPSKGWIKDDSILLEAYVQADAPHGVSWDSKKHTGYVGLKNQGATCYMNSLLQTLFFTNKLRKAVYQMPTESDDSSKSVALALQRVFYDLQFSDKPVGTKKLTKSFGWETLDSFMQHDVQELCRVLLDNMESKMKGTCVEGTIPKLFEGKMISYIKCKHVEFESSRTEPFLDIQLNIKDKKDIYDSFDDYVAEETLEGENKYDAGDYGLQDAAKGIIFHYFPPVLHLHLLRFQYDPCSDTNVKINDRFEFPEKLNLNKYEQTQQSGADASYTLHAVLVHSGDNHGGHYVVFINPKGDGKWCKFDDDVVSCCSKQDAVDNNFGGNDGTDNEVNVRHSTNAYMLVYIRDSAIPDVLQSVTIDDIQEQLIDRFKEERKVEAIRRKERAEQHLYFTMNVYTEDSWMFNRGMDLFCDKTPSIMFKVHKQLKMPEVTKLVADELKWPVEGVRLWPISARQNNSVRPLRITGNESDESFQQILDSVSGQNMFAELSSPLSPMKPLPPSENNVHVMIFLKYYDPKINFISYCGVAHFDRNKKLIELFPYLREKANLPKDTPLLVFEEETHATVNSVPVDEPLCTAIKELMDGDIIVFQPDNPEYPTAADAYQEIQNRIEVLFCDKNNPNDPGITLELSLKSTYDVMAELLAMRLGTSSNLLQFFKIMNYREGPGLPLRHTFDGHLKDLLFYSKPRAPKKIYYQHLTIPISELENKKHIKCTYLNLNNIKEEPKELELYARKDGTVADLLEEAKKVIEFSEGSSKKLRLLEISSCKIMQIVSEDTSLESVSNAGTKNYRIEEIPMDQLTLEPNEFFVPVAHFQKETYQTFGVPFLVKVKNRESFASVKEKIHKQLEKEKDFDKFKFAIVSARCTYISDDEPYLFNKDDIPAPHAFAAADMISSNSMIKFYIGLDHMNKAQKRPKYTPVEKAIKIHN